MRRNLFDINLVLVLSVILLFSGCNYIKNIRLLSGGKLEKKDFVEELSFDYRKGILVLKAQINEDSTWHEFIFDTGAFDGKVEKQLAERLQMPTIATKSNGTAAGIVSVAQL